MDLRGLEQSGESSASGQRVGPNNAVNMPKIVSRAYSTALATIANSHHFRFVGIEFSPVVRAIQCIHSSQLATPTPLPLRWPIISYSTAVMCMAIRLRTSSVASRWMARMWR